MAPIVRGGLTDFSNSAGRTLEPPFRSLLISRFGDPLIGHSNTSYEGSGGDPGPNIYQHGALLMLLLVEPSHRWKFRTRIAY